MTKTKLILGMIWMVLFSFCPVGVAAAQENFSGTWILDKGKTHDLPSGLKSYTMVVTQNEQPLVIETKLEGDLRLSEGGVPGDGGAPGVDRSDVPVHPIDAPPRSAGGVSPSAASGGVRSPGGPAAAEYPSVASSNPAMAFRMLLPKATYSLDGKETTAPVAVPKPGTATLKTKWSKDNRKLELSSVYETETGRRSVTISCKERWMLSGGGEVLQVQRTVDSPQGTDSIKLTFRKGSGEAPTP